MGAARPFVPVAPLAPVAPAAPLLAGVDAELGGLFAQPLRVAAGLVSGLPGAFAGLPGLRPGAFLGLPGLLAGGVGGLAGGVGRVAGGVAFALPHLAGGPGQLLAQAADGGPDVLAELAGDVADGLRQLLLELVELVAAAAQLLAARLGDPVDLAPVLLVVGDQALILEPGQPRVDRARGRGVDAHEPVPQQPDYL